MLPGCHFILFYFTFILFYVLDTLYMKNYAASIAANSIKEAYTWMYVNPKNLTNSAL